MPASATTRPILYEIRVKNHSITKGYFKDFY